MFQIGDYVIYGRIGVCRIDSVCTLQSEDSKQEKEYYLLKPVFTKGSKIYTPKDSPKAKMRKIITKDESEQLINMIPAIEILEEENNKIRTEKCKDALRTYDNVEWVRVIKTLYRRKQQKLNEGRKFYQNDERMLNMAKDYLYGELSISLNLPKDQMEELILKRLDTAR